MEKESKNDTSVSYKALTGLSYRNRVVEAGEIVDDIPVKSLGWLLEGGHIEKVD